MLVITRRRAAFGAVLASLAIVVVFAAQRLATVPGPSGGPVEAAASADPEVETTSGTVASGAEPGAGSLTAGVSGGIPTFEEPEDTSPAGLLVAAARAGDAHCVRELLAAGVAADSESGGQFAIHGAASSGSVAALRLLLAAGAHPEALDRYGNTALTDAALFGHAKAVGFLLEAGADPNAYAEPNNTTPLLAILSGWAMGHSRRSTRFARKEEERFEAARALIQAGADPHFGPGDHPPPALMAQGLGGEIGRLYARNPTEPGQRPR